MDFSTLFISPDGRGRDFRVRGEARASDVTLAPADQARSVPLVLARWAEAGEASLCACLPLPGGDALVLRARNHGRRDSGYDCSANAVIVPTSLGADLEAVCRAVLAAIPEPDGSDRFARQPLSASALRDLPAATHDWSGLDARWHRRCVVTDDTASPEVVLVSILAAMSPPPGPAAPLGWATSLTWALALSGDSAPGLVVVPPKLAAQGAPGYEMARLTPQGFDGARFDTPLPVRIKERFLAQLEPGLRARAAQRLGGDAADGSLTERLFVAACEVIAPLDYETGLAQSLRFAAIPAAEFDGFFTVLARRLFRWFIELEHNTGHLGRILAFAEAETSRALLANVGSLAAAVLDSPALCSEITDDILARLIRSHDLLAVLTARRDLADILRATRPAVTLKLFDALLSGPDLSAPAAQGLTSAARSLFTGPMTGGFAALLRQHLAAPASLARTRLLTELVLLIYQSDGPVQGSGGATLRAGTRHG